MKIVYGIHGYGRGHSSRALAILPELTSRHEVLIFAGGDAYKALHRDYNIVKIPYLCYQSGKTTKFSATATLRHNAPHVLDLLTDGPAFRQIVRKIADFAPNAIISDSDAWTHRAGRTLGIPRISFDHYGAMILCRPPMKTLDRIRCTLISPIYNAVLNRPERIIVTAFYHAPTDLPHVRSIGPILRAAVITATPTRGDYLLVYFTNGRRYFSDAMLTVLRKLSLPVVVYGAGRTGTDGNLDFRAPSNVRFVEDLATCRALFSTAGNQLIGEAMHLGKPMLIMPEDSTEQKFNAYMVEQMGLGKGIKCNEVCPERVNEFLAFAEGFTPPPAVTSVKGTRQAIDAIESAMQELDRRRKSR